MSFWNGWSERVLLDICFLIAVGQSTSHHAAQVTDSGECVTQPWALQVKLIKVLFWIWTWVGPRNRVSAGSPDPPPRALPRRGTLVGHTWACLNFSAVSILNIICKRAAAMQLFALSTVATFRVIATCWMTVIASGRGKLRGDGWKRPLKCWQAGGVKEKPTVMTAVLLCTGWEQHQPTW